VTYRRRFALWSTKEEVDCGDHRTTNFQDEKCSSVGSFFLLFVVDSRAS